VRLRCLRLRLVSGIGARWRPVVRVRHRLLFCVRACVCARACAGMRACVCARVRL
jgi:hypothetical protein